jgi:hypothetical protein
MGWKVMSNWATIIYGRTYEVDFRLIVKPEDFEEQDIEWAKSHILVTTRWAEKLSDRPRWSMFKNHHHCVVGVTCMAAELSDDINEDRIGRPLYVFVGYVAKAPFPPIPPMNLELFKPIYDRYVRQRWLEKSYQTREADLLSKSEYAELAYSQLEYSVDDLSACPVLNTYSDAFSTRGFTNGDAFGERSDRIYLWPDNDENRKKLWLAASQQQAPLSLCLGLAQSQDAIQGVFLNATALDVSEKIEVNKPKKVTSQEQKEEQKTELPPGQKQDNLTKQKRPRGKKTVESVDKKSPNSSQQNESQTADDLSTIASAVFGFLKIGAEIIIGKGQPQEQEPTKKMGEKTNSKQPKGVEDSVTKQNNPFSGFLKPKSETDQQSENAKKDDSDWL